MKNTMKAFALSVSAALLSACMLQAVEKGKWIELIGENGLNEFRQPLGEWVVVSEASMSQEDEKLLTSKPGKGVLVNGPTGKTTHLFTTMEHADIEAHIEFMVPRKSNSGVYFMGRYEIQILDSHDVEKPQHWHCGGIYQRWKWPEEYGFEGRSPRVNAAREPGEWQTYDVIFRAPRFDENGKKIKNAMFVRVVHNGTLIHENQEVTGPTRAAAYNDEKPMGPLMIQGDHGPVALRNVRIKVLED